MKKALLFSAAALSFAVAAPAQAATFVNVGDSATITFDSTVPGTSATLLLTLFAEVEALAQYTFNFTLTNTSNPLTNPSSRVSVFAFNDGRPDTPTGTVNIVDNNIDTVSFNGNVSGPVGTREICLSDVNCAGGGSGGATIGDPAIGRFTLDYAGSLSSLTLTDFVVRYQSTGLDAQGSGHGFGTEVPPIPEPATWAMMLIGFGVLGAAMRRRKDTTVRSRISFA